ncbi:hypothetical protein [Asticcacaulis endophyticus]|nr:hypothetical protein [Asticcacaulis endophyticus]
MPDKLFYPVMAAVALIMIALSLVWPQGIGSRSPAPFGKAVELPDVVRMERDRATREANKQAETARLAAEKAALKATEAQTAADPAAAQ